MKESRFHVLIPIRGSVPYLELCLQDWQEQEKEEAYLHLLLLRSSEESQAVARKWAQMNPEQIQCHAPEMGETEGDFLERVQRELIDGLERGRQGKSSAASYLLLAEANYRYGGDTLATIAASLSRQSSDLILYALEEDYVDEKGELLEYDLRGTDTIFWNQNKEEGSARPGHCQGEEERAHFLARLEEEGILDLACNKAISISYLSRLRVCPLRLESQEEQEEQLTMSGLRMREGLLQSASKITLLSDPMVSIAFASDLLED